MRKYKDIQWVIQKNLIYEGDLNTLKESIRNIGVDFVEVEVMPFTPDIPFFPTEKRSIFYGSVTLNNLIFNKLNEKGLFFNNNFSMENYFNHWKEHMLNYGALITTFKDLMKMNYDPDKLLFIRPDDDTKSFAGELKSFLQIETWYEKLKIIENTNLDLESKIIVSEPYNIKTEWRLWIVNGKVVASSKYRQYFKLKKEEGCPEEVKKFAEERCTEYTPHNCFVMDIALCGDSYYIVECGGMNSAGFYKANISDIVSSVTEYFSTL